MHDEMEHEIRIFHIKLAFLLLNRNIASLYKQQPRITLKPFLSRRILAVCSHVRTPEQILLSSTAGFMATRKQVFDLLLASLGGEDGGGSMLCWGDSCMDFARLCEARPFDIVHSSTTDR